MGAAAFLQAESGGWKLFAASFGLIAVGVAASFFFVSQSGDAGLSELTNGPDSLRFKALIFLPFAGVVLLLGSLAGAVLRRTMSAGRLGVVVFAASFVLINLLSFSI